MRLMDGYTEGMCPGFEPIFLLLTRFSLVLAQNTVIMSKTKKLNVMREVLNVEESLPVVGVAPPFPRPPIGEIS